MELFDVPEIFKTAYPNQLRLKEDQKKEISLWLKDKNAPMIFAGPPGRGKTYAALALYNMREKG